MAAGGSSGGYASSGYASTGASSGSWGSAIITDSCSDCGGTTTSGDVIIEDHETDSGMPTAPIEEVPSEARRSRTKGVLMVNVPDSAQVVVNGMSTTSEGANRRYVSHGLKPGHSYRYEVKAMVEHDGKLVEETKTAILRAGQVARLDFDLDRNVVRTSLTLNVPEDAQVLLSGNPTQTTGPVRRFSTTKIQEGEKWDEYVVQVSVERNGQTLTKEQRVTLSGGEQRNLEFDFDQTELAAAN